MFSFRLENDKMAGIVIIDAEPKELTFVNIVGPIEVDQLAALGGQYSASPGSIPSLWLEAQSQSKKDQGEQR